MQVLLNGEPHLLEQSLSITDFITSLSLEGKFAIELNQNIVPRSEFPKTILNPGDNIEIVQAIGGG